MENYTASYLDLVEKIHTHADVELLNHELELLSASLFKVEATAVEQILKTQVRSTVANVIRTSFERLGIALNDAEKVKQWILGLQKELNKLQIVKLTLAFEPTDEFLEKLYTWTATSFGMGVIMEVKKDSSILGGIAIEFKGMYKEITLGAILKQVFEKRRQDIEGYIKQIKDNNQVHNNKEESLNQPNKEQLAV